MSKPTDTPSPEPSPEMMERARKVWSAICVHDKARAINCTPCLALAFSEVAREAREAAEMRGRRVAVRLMGSSGWRKRYQCGHGVPMGEWCSERCATNEAREFLGIRSAPGPAPKPEPGTEKEKP